MFKNINKVVRVLVIVDFFYNSAFASLAPVFAIFIIGQIEGGSASIAGFAAALYWLTKSIFQLPIAQFLDKTRGESDDFWAMFSGYFLSSLVLFAYLFATKPWHLYLIQTFYGLAMAWAVPAWYAIFTRHVDKWRIGFEWSLQSVFSVGVAAAGAAALGGYIVDKLGFETLFIGAGTLGVLASLIILSLRNHLLPSDYQEKIWPERKPHH